MATEIGIVKALIGSAVITAADGSQRNLVVGDRVYADEIITTGDGSAIEIEFSDGSLMDLGRNSQALLDNEIFDPQQTIVSATDLDIAGLQDALVDGEDPTQQGDAPAAGPESEGGNEGVTTVVVERLDPTVAVTSGFETSGVSRNFLDDNNLFGGTGDNTGSEDAASNNSVSPPVPLPPTAPPPKISDQSDNDSDTISLNVSGNFNGTALAFSAIGLPSGLIINPVTGIIGGVVDSSASQGGPYNVVITANNGSSIVTQPFVWNVANPPPEADNDSASLDEDTIHNGSVAGNDGDPDGDATSFSLNTGVSNGTLVFNNDGSYTYTPNPNYNGNDSFTYTITDADGATDTATVTLTINPIDDPTNTVADTGNTDEGATLTVAAGSGGVLDNDSDVDNSLTVTSFTVAGVAGTHAAGSTVTITGVGDLTLNADGGYTFDPVANYSGAVPITTYTTNTGSSDTLTITINPIDDATITAPDAGNANEDTTLTVIAANGVLSNDSDSDDVLSVSSFTIVGVAGTHAAGSTVTITGVGDLTLNADGGYTFTSADNYSGPVPVATYTTNTGSTDTLTLNVAPIADAPTLVMSVTALSILGGATQIIDINNVTTVGNGFTVSALGLDDSPAAISIRTNPTNEGFGVQGNASGASAEIGSTSTASEKLNVMFDSAVSSINVSFAWMHAAETAQYDFYLSGVHVGSGTADGITDTIDGPFTLTPGTEFDQVVFSAPLDPADDYLINSITFDLVAPSYTYDIDISAVLTDVDGSETLSGISLAGLPIGSSISTAENGDGTYNPGTVTLVSDHELTPVEINAITGSVTSTDGVSTATTTSNVKVDIAAAGDDALLEGSAGNDILAGGTGDDVLSGGGGNDILTGGGGDDIFIWNSSDIGTSATPAHDEITDFDANNDVLNLADLLSDGSHSIEGITTGSGDLQLNIKDGTGDVVQEIELHGVSTTGTTATQLLDDMLSSGAINDGI
ncbi:MAG: retention module-containing protein [Methylophaga sp.]|nr:retention module-containing protein [Methylophaga sp.]